MRGAPGALGLWSEWRSASPESDYSITLDSMIVRPDRLTGQLGSPGRAPRGDPAEANLGSLARVSLARVSLAKPPDGPPRGGPLGGWFDQGMFT